MALLVAGAGEVTVRVGVAGVSSIITISARNKVDNTSEMSDKRRRPRREENKQSDNKGM
jgi:hypothetical protein